ncbi:hypothetical protein Bbelb_245390 [Branchiostoma belcheri]|nr:hypothetical protein Bbelb_245390 [Branchiostoma belcheri]
MRVISLTITPPFHRPNGCTNKLPTVGAFNGVTKGHMCKEPVPNQPITRRLMEGSAHVVYIITSSHHRKPYSYVDEAAGQQEETVLGAMDGKGTVRFGCRTTTILLCIFTAVTVKTQALKTNLTIMGFFPNSEAGFGGSEGSGVPAAVELALQDINENNNVLADYNLVMLWNGTKTHLMVFDLLVIWRYALAAIRALCRKLHRQWAAWRGMAGPVARHVRTQAKS